jgi:hypothetical protein
MFSVNSVKYFYLFWNLSDLKWLRILNYGTSPSNLVEKYDEDSMFLMDAVFVNVFSLMQLEYLDFKVKNARVSSRVCYDHA